jgi:hypothetical protein
MTKVSNNKADFERGRLLLFYTCRFGQLPTCPTVVKRIHTQSRFEEIYPRIFNCNFL